MRKFRKYTATALVAMMVAGMTMSGYQPADVSASQESEYIIVTKDKKSMKTVESKYNTMIDTQEQNTDFLKDENVLVSKMTAKEADIVNKDQKVVSVEKNTMVNASETESTTAAKDHGDAGILLGSPIKDGDKVVIIEDVTTSGKSIEETFPIIQAQGDVTIKGLMVSLNRMERGKGEKSALVEIQEKYGFPANAIVSMSDVVEHLYNKPCNGKVVIDDEIKAAIDKYYEEYGAKEA